MLNPIGIMLLKAKVLAPLPENIHAVAEALLHDDVIGMPTETVYGLAGNGRSPAALARIFETKERPTFDPLILHIPCDLSPSPDPLDRLERLCLIDRQQLSALAQKRTAQLIQKFWPGPLTLVLPKHPDVPDLATSGLLTVAIRMPLHPVAQALLAAVQLPLAAPSANRFGKISPTTSQAVVEELGDRISWVLEGGPCAIGIESTIIKVESNGDLILLRQGGTPPEAITQALQTSVSKPQHPSNPMAPTAPGMLTSHYAPSKPLHLLPCSLLELPEEALKKMQDSPSGPLGVLLFSGDPERASSYLNQKINRSVIVKSLSLKGNLEEAAKNLFTLMRALDASPAPILFAEPCPVSFGLGYGIQDRLLRASSKAIKAIL